MAKRYKKVGEYEVWVPDEDELGPVGWIVGGLFWFFVIAIATKGC